MERFTQLFGNLLVFVYHCLDRIVINGYLNGLSRPEQAVHFVREVLGIPVLSRNVLSQRTNVCQGWVQAYARNHKIPIEWAGKDVRKEDYVLPALRRPVNNNVSDQRAEVSHPGPQLPHPGASAEPFPSLLLLPPGRGAGADRD
jgi:hypothetical protein